MEIVKQVEQTRILLAPGINPVDHGFQATPTIGKQHDHLNAATSRQIAELKTIIKILLQHRSENRPFHILDYYGGKRTMVLMEKILTRIYKKYPTVANLITFEWYRPIVTPKDVVEYTQSLTKWPSIQPDSTHTLLVVDIYHYGPAHYTDLPCQNIYFVQQFYGLNTVAGINFDTAPYYIEDGILYQKPGSDSELWVPHEIKHTRAFESTNFVEGKNNNMFWIRKENVMDYFILKAEIVSKSKTKNTIPLPAPHKQSGIIYLEAENCLEKIVRVCKSLFITSGVARRDALTKSSFNRDLYVDLETANRYMPMMIYQTRAPFKIASLVDTVTNDLNGKDYEEIFEHWNIPRAVVVQDTVDYILYQNIEQEANSVKANFQQFTPSLDILKASKRPSPPPENILGRHKYFSYNELGLGLLCLGYAGYRFFSRTQSGYTVALSSTLVSEVLNLTVMAGACIFDPIVEEVAKHKFPIVRTILPLYEVYKYGFLQTWGGVIPPTHIFLPFISSLLKEAAYRYVCHNIILKRSTLFRSIMAHSAFNFLFMGLLPSISKMALSSNFLTMNVYLLSVLVFILISKTFEMLGEPTESDRVSDRPEIKVEEMIIPNEQKQIIPTLPQQTSPDFEIFFDAFVELNHMKLQMDTITQATPMFLPSYYFGIDKRTREKLKDFNSTPGQWVLLGTKAMMVRPAGEEAFMFAYSVRNAAILAATNPLHLCETICSPNKPSKTCKVGKRWSLLINDINKKRIFKFRNPATIIEQLITSEEWVKHFGSAAKKNRAANALDRKREGENTSWAKVECFLKSDEVLFPKQLDPNSTQLSIKPRVIQNVHPDLQAIVYKAMDLVTKYAKQYLFNIDNLYTYNGVQLTLTFGSGMNDEQLDIWYERAMADILIYNQSKNSKLERVHCILAGDDFFAIHVNPITKVIRFIENDFSRYDRTQSFHALEAEYWLIERIGVPRTIIGKMRSSTRTTPVYKPRKGSNKFGPRMSVKMKAPVQRFSGGGDTTFGNTSVSIFGCLFACKKGKFDLTRLSKLGFESKLKFFDSPLDGPTFLKGWWVPTAEGKMKWLPLPSAMIKLGKIVTDPSSIFKGKETMLAHRMAGKAVAAGYKNVPYDYPILGPFVLRSMRLVDTDVEAYSRHQFKTALTREEIDLDAEVAIEMFVRRYGFNPIDLDKQIYSAPFPCILMDDRWVTLAQRDYG